MSVRALVAIVVGCMLGAALVLASIAWGQGGQGELEGGFHMQSNGGGVGDCDTLNVLPPGVVVTRQGNVCTLSVPGGGGDGANPVLPMSTCGKIDGTVPVYFGPGTCSDPAEVPVQIKLKNAGTYGQLSCTLSGGTGLQSVTVVLRVGTCGVPLTSSAVTCTMGPGTFECDSGGAVAAVGAGQCIAARAQGTGLLAIESPVNCGLERVG